MKFEIKAVISIQNEVDLTILDHTISPENVTMPVESGTVRSRIQDGKFITEINGNMPIGRLINTIDDIVKTAILAKKIVQSSDEIKD